MLEVQEDFPAVMVGGVVVEVLVVMERGVWDTLQPGEEEEEVSGVEARTLSSVAAGVVPRPVLVPAG